MKAERFSLVTKCLVPVSDVPLLPQNILQFADGGKNYKPQNLCWVPAWLIVLQIHKANCYQKEKSSLSATYLAPARYSMAAKGLMEWDTSVPSL